MSREKEFRALLQSFVEVMSSAIDERTPYNLTHTRHMAENGNRFIDYINKVCRDNGREEYFSAAHKDELIMSIWLHDIGKLVIPLEVMNKNTRLQPEQYAAVCHRMERAELIAEIRLLKGEITEEEKDASLEEIQALRALVDRVNHAGHIESEIWEKVESVKTLTYFEIDGTKRPWFTEAEYEALTIRHGTLTSKEREIMEAHVLVTDKLLGKMKFTPELSHVREWATAHHELLNGTGYPYKKVGEQIPYEARIITILDIFDALVADDRPYKPGMSINEALEILRNMAEQEGKLDPELTRLFLASRCWEQNQ